jgi:acyl carrier protein
MASEKEEIFERLKGLLVNLLKIYREKKVEDRPKLTLDTDLIVELGVDSLESLDLMNAIEEEFQVSPNMNEANSKTKIGQIVDYIIELKARKSIKR